MGFKIAFCGKMASGKTTLCEIIKEIEPRCVVLSFAGPIKEIATNYFGMVAKNREMLIDIGKLGRHYDVNMWVNHLLKKAKSCEFVLCDDLRQFNEYAALQKDGWKLVRVDISPQLQKQRLGEKYQDKINEHRPRLNKTNTNRDKINQHK